MSLVNPGGLRVEEMSGRVFGADQIRRVCNQRLKDRDHVHRARTSIATGNRHTGQAHEHKREISRRLRQQERRAA